MMNRAAPDTSPALAFTTLEIPLLDRLAEDKRNAVFAKEIDFRLPDHDRQTWRLSCPCERFSSWQYGRLERAVPIHQY